MATLIPIAWYWPTAASGPVPCRWRAWLPPSCASQPGQWIEVVLFSVPN